MIRHHLYAACLLFSSHSYVAAIQAQCPRSSVISSLLPAGACGTPVYDTTPVAELAARRDVPWTQLPHCANPSLIESSDKFCVYSSSTYNDGSGIALVVHPETAASLAGAVRDPLPAWRSRRHLACQGRLRQDANALPYTVTPIPGKGHGVTATRHIRQFETILTNFPALLADNIFFSSREEGPPGSSGLFQEALDQLTDKDRFLNLARSKSGDADLVADIFRTNAFGITVDGRDMKGVYPEIARLNHACDPNAYSRFTKQNLAMSAIATRDIAPGEEITISYIPLGMPTVHRTKALGNWGFNCTCDLCSAAPEAREESDERRERMMEVYYAIQDDSTSYSALVGLTREFIELARLERLLPKVSEYYHTFMRVYYGAGDAGTARKYGRLSLKFAEIFSDPDGEFCSGLRRDLDRIDRELRDREHD